MTGRERILLAFAHREPDRTPFFEQGIASRVASDILGRPAMTGGGAFRFQAALAAYDGPEAWAEFQAGYLKDYAALVEALDFDMVSLPWVGGQKPTRRLDEHTLRFDDADADAWHIHRFDEASDTFQEVDSAFRSEGLPAVFSLSSPSWFGRSAAPVRLLRNSGGGRSAWLTSGKSGSPCSSTPETTRTTAGTLP